MTDKSKNLFVWKECKTKEIKNNEDQDLNIWKLRAVKATNDAIKNIFSNTETELLPHQSLIDDSIYSEAKDLVKGWLTNKKVYGNYSSREDYLCMPCDNEEFIIPTRSEVHKEWEHLVKKIETKEDFKEEIDSYLSVQNENLKEDKKLKSVISNLHKKTFVDPSKLQKIESDKSIDMKKRIENRQEQVKKKREERLKLEEMLKLDKIAQKEARIEGLKILKEEKRQKELSIKKEEELLQLEMNKIRAELQLKREQEFQEQKKLKEAKEMLEKQEKKNATMKIMEENSKAMESKICQSTNDRFKIISELVETKFLNKKIKLMQYCFQDWKNLLVSRKIQMEKANTWFNWKHSRKVFRAWHKYSRTRTINWQIDMDRQKIKLVQMKTTMAVDFWQRNLLKRCILNWSLYVIDEKEARWCQKLEEMRKKKMMNYIKVLQEKALENQEQIENLSSETCFKSTIKCEKNHQQFSRNSGSETERPRTTNERIECSASRNSARPMTSKQRPKEAWQITRKDVYLPTNPPLENPNQNKAITEPHQRKSLKPPKVINSYAHRDAAQKEIIKQQQLQIKEQQRLIMEMKGTEFLSEVHKVQHESATEHEYDQMVAPKNSPANDETNYDSSKHQDTKYRSKFVIQMEMRSIEREKIKAERLERQRIIEAEKKKQLEEKLVEQTRLENEEKVKREKLLKEKKEKERKKEQARLQQVTWLRESNEKADRFYKQILLKRYGIKTWSKILKIKENDNDKANRHFFVTILRKTFTAWWADTEKQIQYHEKIVQTFYNQILIRRCFYHIKLFKHRYELMDQSAEDHYLASLLKRFFRKWRITNHREQMRLDKLGIQCENLYIRTLLKKSFTVWRQLPMAKRIERDRERRKDVMRQKVASIIPDFKYQNSD